MSPQPTFISRLLASVETNASLPIFKVPEASCSGVTTKWTDITYRHYMNDVDKVARHLTAQLRLHDVPRGSIIGLWVGGLKYDDYVYLAALVHAGYIPQLFSLAYTYPGIVFELLKESGALVLLHDPSLASSLTHAPVPIIPARNIDDLALFNAPSTAELPDARPTADDSLVFMYHTSGSTSGRPKLVPFPEKRLPSAAGTVVTLWSEGQKVHGSFITPILGSVAHAGTLFQYLATVRVGACMVFPSSLKYNSEELSNMIRECGVNTLTRYSPLATTILEEAQTNQSLLATLRGLSSFSYCGVQLSEELMNWGFNNGVPLINAYGTTECGGLMTSVFNLNSRYLKVIPNIIHKFQPIESSPIPGDENTEKLFELIILPESPNIPAPGLVDSDGIYRTGDLFEPAHGLPDMWIFRGRKDDWIKSELGMKCDTRAIEEKVRETCRELIIDCVVVGNGRPSPAILVEAAKSGLNEDERKALQEEVIKRTKDFSARRLVHERVTDPRLVLVLDGEKLPRTMAKGNIRRKASEDQFQNDLTAIYASLA